MRFLEKTKLRSYQSDFRFPIPLSSAAKCNKKLFYLPYLSQFSLIQANFHLLEPLQPAFR